MKTINYKVISLLSVAAGLLVSCNPSAEDQTASESRLIPIYVTDTVNFDSDDPAIWVHPEDATQSLIFGTDKREMEEGGIFAFDLTGKEVKEKRITGIDRPNNIDVSYGFKLDSVTTTDVVMFSERGKQQMRMYSVPDMKPLDEGGLPVFEDSENRAVMGLALYKRPADDSLFAIVSRKGDNAPTEDYLYQYALFSEDGKVQSRLVRKFGKFSGNGEIEAIAVDHQMGYIYYSDELYGIRKYYADPAMGNEELAVFGTDGFTEDREGISIYHTSDSTGYVLVSDQQARQFRVFPREGSDGSPHTHDLHAVVKMLVNESDGSEVSAVKFNEDFPEGLFVAMSDNKTFELYDWRMIREEILKQAQ